MKKKTLVVLLAGSLCGCFLNSDVPVAPVASVSQPDNSPAAKAKVAEKLKLQSSRVTRDYRNMKLP